VLITSTLLTLVAIPAFYEILDETTEKAVLPEETP
jgi:Cu/Ag efflux pump CusA